MYNKKVGNITHFTELLAPSSVILKFLPSNLQFYNLHTMSGILRHTHKSVRDHSVFTRAVNFYFTNIVLKIFLIPGYYVISSNLFISVKSDIMN